jgi:hypothetical protein
MKAFSKLRSDQPLSSHFIMIGKMLSPLTSHLPPPGRQPEEQHTLQRVKL